MKKVVVVVFVMLILIGGITNGACPLSDFTDDCEVNLQDLAVIASGWLTTYSDTDLYSIASEWLIQGVPEDPAKMAWVYINDDGSGMKDRNGNPISKGGFTGEMSKYETTNAQYCQFLNEALASGDISIDIANPNIAVGANGSNNGVDFVGKPYFDIDASSLYSLISYSDGVFSVLNRDGYDMSNHPVLEVSWYGATAFCNYYGYRLPTEWEWQAVADYDGSFTYGCGATIDFSKANYYAANPLNLSYLLTSPVDHFDSYGYGMNDMAGNAWEWTSTVNGNNSILCGGSWGVNDFKCAVSFREDISSDKTGTSIGFRVCR